MPDRTVSHHKQMLEDLEWYRDYAPETGARAVAIIEDAIRTPESGLGLPKRLAALAGVWSRRVNLVHRVHYLLADHELRFLSCRGHDLPQHLYDAIRAGEDV